MSQALPTAVSAAWRERPLRVGGLTLQPFTLGQFMLLHDLDSPLVNPAKPFTLRALAEALVVLSRPSTETRQLLALPITPHWVPGLERLVASLGAPESPEDLRARILTPEWENLVYEVADSIPERELAGLQGRLAAHLTSAFDKAVPMAAAPGGGGGPNFPAPPATPVSGGSSASSTPSPTNTTGAKRRSSTGSASRSSSASTRRSAPATACTPPASPMPSKTSCVPAPATARKSQKPRAKS